MRPRGGIIGASITPTQTAASGVWTVREADAYARSGAWPALPGAPTSVSGTAGNAQVALTWTAPSATGGSSITDYTVQYSSNSGSSWTTFTRSASTAASATVTGLTNSTAYIFRVAAVTGYGTGAFSAASSSVTPTAANSFSAVPAGWTGSGTSGIPVTPNAGFSTQKTLTAGVSGTLRITGSVRVDVDDTCGVIQVNGTTVKTFSSLGTDTAQSVNISQTISAGQNVVFTAWNGAQYSNWGTNLQIWIA